MSEEYTASGNTVIGDSATVASSYWSYAASGNILLSDSVSAISPSWTYTASGSLSIGSSADSTTSYSLQTGGVQSLGGSATSSVIFTCIASGGITLTGRASPLFRTQITTTFTWDISEGVLRTFRVEGKCSPPTNTDTPCANNGTMQYLANVQAHSITDLCSKLKSRGYGAVRKVQMWSLPVNKSDWSEGAVAADNRLTTVSFSNIPGCLDLTVDSELSVQGALVSELIFQDEFSYEASGSLGTSGDCEFISSAYAYTASGGLVSGGDVVVSSPQYYYYDCSGGLGFGYSADYYRSDYGILTATAGFSATIESLNVTYGTVEAGTLSLSTEQIEATCCTSLNLPQILYVRHELARSDRLSKFLQVNGLTLARNLKLMYSQHRNSWYTNLNYRGNSVNQSTKEAWNIIFEFGCLAENAVLGVPEDVWGFSLCLQSRNLTNSRLEVTRLVMEFDPEIVCNVTSSLKFRFNLDTNLIKTTPTTVRTVVYTDGLGIFDGPSYSRNPLTSFEVGSASPDLGVSMFDQSEPFRKVLLGST